jgi:hypothetical protein
MPLPELVRRLWNQAPQRRLSRWEISLKNISNARDATNTLTRRIKNMRIRLAKKHTQISITKLRDRKQIAPQPIYKRNIIESEAVIYLDDAGTEHLTLFVIPKSHILLVWQGSEAGEPFLFLIMCHEQPESMSHVSSKHPSITYTGRENVDDSVLGLVR